MYKDNLEKYIAMLREKNLDTGKRNAIEWRNKLWHYYVLNREKRTLEKIRKLTKGVNWSYTISEEDPMSIVFEHTKHKLGETKGVKVFLTRFESASTSTCDFLVYDQHEEILKMICNLMGIGDQFEALKQEYARVRDLPTKEKVKSKPFANKPLQKLRQSQPDLPKGSDKIAQYVYEKLSAKE